MGNKSNVSCVVFVTGSEMGLYMDVETEPFLGGELAGVDPLNTDDEVVDGGLAVRNYNTELPEQVVENEAILDCETGQFFTGELTAGDMLNSQEEVDDGLVVNREDSEQAMTCKSWKRIRKVENWKKNKRKIKRARGEEYVSTTGNTVPAKNVAVSRPIDCRCPLKCCDKITNDRQNQLRDQFYEMADWIVQTAYICGQVKVITVAKRYTKNDKSRRQRSKLYYLPDADGHDVRVRTGFFAHVLALSDGRIARATLHGIPHADRRGKHEPHNKTPAAESAFA